MTIHNQPSVAVVIPARDAEATLSACLQAVQAQTYPIRQTIVFNDGSSDRTEQIALDFGATVLRHEGAALGPAAGRNRASAIATSDLLLFVDADVLLAPDALAKLVGDVVANGAVAGFGSYDAAPPVPRLTSVYANLRHHFVHQIGNRNARTFWSGIGLIDRLTFQRLDGFDARRFSVPSVEDIELGSRLWQAGHRIRLVPEAQGTHCKDWHLFKLWRTDIVQRALPWAEMIVDDGASGTELNLGREERVKAVLALAVLASAAFAVVLPAAVLACALAAASYLWMNRRFLALVSRTAGAKGWLAAAALHWCYHLYATATFAGVVLATTLKLRRRKREWHTMPASLGRRN